MMANKLQAQGGNNCAVTTRMATFFLLYFVQGMPYGFQDKLLPVLLRKEGHSYTQLSLMKLLLIPWLCKALWAPVVDTYRTMRWWLLYSMIAMAACCFASMALPTDSLIGLGICLLMLNFFSATQDIAVDAIAIAMLRPDELGRGNTVQVVGYKAGMVFAGGFLLWIRLHLGWRWMFATFGILYVLTVLGVASVSQDQNEFVHHPSSKISSPRKNKGIFTQLRSLYGEVLSVPGTPLLCAYVLTYKLGERGCLSNFPLFLVDAGASVQNLGWWNGILSQAASIAGSIYGGYTATTVPSVLKLLRHHSIYRAIVILVQHFVVVYWVNFGDGAIIVHPLIYGVSLFSMAFLNYYAGVITTTTFTLMMAHSQRAPSHIQATHYTTLATLEVAGKLLFASLAGIFIDLVGFSGIYFVFFAMSVAALPIIRIQEEKFNVHKEM